MKTISVILLCLSTTAAISATMEDVIVDKNGGWVKISGKGTIAVIDCRCNPSTNDYLSGVEKIRNTFQPQIVFKQNDGFTMAKASSILKGTGDNAAVFVVDDSSLPMTLTAAEEKWTLINAAKIKTDNPDKEKYQKRMSLLFMRQCCRILGSDATKSPECCLYPVFSLKDLDDVKSMDVAIGVFMAVNDSMSRLGMESVKIVTYRDACELGKAPAPTNDIQKAIWDKIHAPPKNPMKIEFDPKKGR